MSAWANRILLFANISLLIVAGYYVVSHGLAPSPPGFDYKDLVTILLTAVSVILVAVTVFVAVLAIWGYNAIRESAEKAAREVAREIARDVAQTVAARESEAYASLSSGSSSATDIKEDEELAKALQAGDPQKGDGNGG